MRANRLKDILLKEEVCFHTKGHARTKDCRFWQLLQPRDIVGVGWLDETNAPLKKETHV